MSRVASAACVARVRPRVERPTVASGSVKSARNGKDNALIQISDDFVIMLLNRNNRTYVRGAPHQYSPYSSGS